MTDVEGDAAYFDRFVALSKVLEFGDGHEVIFRDDENDDMFVCGGDTWDKGGSDLYVTRQLLALHDRYGPERVHFLLGNRDINKMRIPQELGTNADDVALPEHGGVWWQRGSGRRGDPDRPHDDACKVPDDAVRRLQWMLGRTMGSPDAFELRRGELRRASSRAHDRDASTSSVSDLDVVRSYIDACTPVGPMGRYLRKGKLALKIGKVMFMHGALPFTRKFMQENSDAHATPIVWEDFFSYCMPWKMAASGTEPKVEHHPNPSYHSVQDIDKDILEEGSDSPLSEWINALNAFATAETQAWKCDFEQKAAQGETLDTGCWITRGGYGNATNGDNLMQYVVGSLPPDRSENPTVVYSSWTSDGMPKLASTNETVSSSLRHVMRDFFRETQLNLIVTGHQPHGDTPLPMQIIDTTNNDRHGKGSWIVSCDTSYSSDTNWEYCGGERENLGRGTSQSFRGDTAVSELVIDQCIETGELNDVHYHGVLSDGSMYESTNLMTCSPDSKYIGKILDESMFDIVGCTIAHRGDPSKNTDTSDDFQPKRWWVKCKLKSGEYLVTSGKGYNIWNAIAILKQ